MPSHSCSLSTKSTHKNYFYQYARELLEGNLNRRMRTAGSTPLVFQSRGVGQRRVEMELKSVGMLSTRAIMQAKAGKAAELKGPMLQMNVSGS